MIKERSHNRVVLQLNMTFGSELIAYKTYSYSLRCILGGLNEELSIWVH